MAFVLERLLKTGPIRSTAASTSSKGFNCSSTPPTAESSKENSNLLFASFDNASPLTTKSKKKPMPRKTAKSSARSTTKSFNEKGLKVPDMIKGRFSDDTLNFVAEGLQRLEVVEEGVDSSNQSDDVFKSPKTQDERSQAEDQADGTNLSEDIFHSPEPLGVPDRGGGGQSENSPFIGMQATSTPNLRLPSAQLTVSASKEPSGYNASEAEVEVEKESLKSPLLVPSTSRLQQGLVFSQQRHTITTPGSELVKRKGGKHWRRSIRGFLTDNRRATMVRKEETEGNGAQLLPIRPTA